MQPMVAEIGWTHNLIVLDKCKDDLEREFYLGMNRKYGWTQNVLAIRIQNQIYEKTLLGRNNFNETWEGEYGTEDFGRYTPLGMA